MTTQTVDPASTPGEEPAPEFLDPTAPALPEGLKPVERAHVWVMRSRLAISWAPFMIGALVLDNFVLETFSLRGALSAIIWLVLRVIVRWRALGSSRQTLRRPSSSSCSPSDSRARR